MLLNVLPGCESPNIRPSDKCVAAGSVYTCTATSGNLGAPNYTLHYWTTGSSKTVYGQSYKVSELGNFSLACAASYRHQQCPEYHAVCYKNISATVVHGERCLC